MLVVDNASTDGTGEWLRTQPVTAELLTRTPAAPAGSADGFGLVGGARRRPRLADGRRRAAGARLPGAAAGARGARLLGSGGARRARTRPAVSSRSGCRAGRGWSTTWKSVRGRRAGRADPGRGDPVQRRAGDRELVERIGVPRAEFFIWGDDVEYLWRAEAAGARIATVVDATCCHPSHRRPRDADDVRPHDVQPQPERPQALLHGPQQPREPAPLPGWPHVLMFWAKTVWFYRSPSRDRAGSALSARATYAGLRGDFTGQRRVPAVSESGRPSRSSW